MAGFAITRRRLLAGAAIASAAPLSGCFDFLGERDGKVRDVLAQANSLTYRVQRRLLGTDDLAREYAASDIRQPQKPNGSTNPRDPDYLRLAAADFSGYRLRVKGLVERPLLLSLDEVRAMSARTQITRHDCVEGWSCIAKWTGTPLSSVLAEARITPKARFVVFECFDTMENGFAGPVKYYESIDLRDALHPQTILAYGLNDRTLPVSYGAPLRVRVERQLGYKMAKYIRAVTVVDRLEDFGKGGGGYWEDRGYDWFAGI